MDPSQKPKTNLRLAKLNDTSEESTKSGGEVIAIQDGNVHVSTFGTSITTTWNATGSPFEKPNSASKRIKQVRKFKDELNLKNEASLTKEFEEGGKQTKTNVLEQILFSCDLIKINYWNNYQNRMICITNKNIYHLKKNNPVARLFSSKSIIIRKKFPILSCNRFVYSNTSDQFILGTYIYDLVYESNNKNSIIEYTMLAIELNQPDKAVDFTFIEDFGVNEFANHEGRVSSKKPKGEVLVHHPYNHIELELLRIHL